MTDANPVTPEPTNTDNAVPKKKQRPSYKAMVVAGVAVMAVIYLITYLPPFNAMNGSEIVKTGNGIEAVPWLFVFRGLLLAFASAACASLLVELAFTKWAIEDLRGATAEALSEATKELHVLDGCKRAGVENVFPTRASFYEHLALQLHNLDHHTVVKVIGISLRDFFREGPPEQGAISKLRDAFHITSQGGKVRYRISLLDPMSQPGKQRSFREEPDTVNFISRTGLFDDVQYAIETYLRTDSKPCPHQRLAQYSRKEPHFRPTWNMDRCADCKRPICMCLYETSPHCFLVELPDSLYIEQYHYGQSGGGRKGGQSPVLQLSRNAHAFGHLQGHFDYVWTTGKLITRDIQKEFNLQNMNDTGQELNSITETLQANDADEASAKHAKDGIPATAKKAPEDPARRGTDPQQ